MNIVKRGIALYVEMLEHENKASVLHSKLRELYTEMSSDQKQEYVNLTEELDEAIKERKHET
jgi:hypothetical protein